MPRAESAEDSYDRFTVVYDEANVRTDEERDHKVI